MCQYYVVLLERTNKDIIYIFAMCCRMGTIACRCDINNLVGNGSELQVVLFIPEIIFSGSVTRSKLYKVVVHIGIIESIERNELTW